METVLPHVPMTVEVLSLVNDLDNWSNVNVRVIGRFVRTVNGLYCLESVLEPDGPYRINLNVELLPKYPLINDVIQVFGELRSTTHIFLVAKFFSLLHVHHHHHHKIPKSMQTSISIAIFVLSSTRCCYRVNTVIDNLKLSSRHCIAPEIRRKQDARSHPPDFLRGCFPNNLW
ncbi:uncharacterized protein LOC124798531 [Schistocerca piceifrons]|uniref:uncharacterized protein LOC124798531 n=1 Tax=Schistocerca piceifrons TaxID=274613 RepID=UPI001F5F8D8F|nr:uncharacterized protein LOC124798531 [Schistocerca piceifrons]